MAQVFLVDQNCLRTEELAALVSKPESKFVLSDEALYEMCKSPQWERTLRESLYTLSAQPSKTYAGKSMSDVLRWELKHKESIDGHLIDQAGTVFLRRLLDGVLRGVDTDALTHMKENIHEAQEELAKIHLNHEENKANLVELVDQIATTEGSLAADLRKGVLSREARLSRVKNLAVQAERSYLRKNGFNYQQTELMIRRRPASLRFGLVRVWYAFDWLKQLGIESIKAQKVTNEKLDYRYVVLATFLSGGLLTRETQMRRCYLDVAEVLRRWRVF